jgi:hypothetical protein
MPDLRATSGDGRRERRVLVAETTAGSLAYMGLVFLAGAALSAFGIFIWFPYVKQHPPPDGTLRYEHWRITTSKYLRYYRGLLILLLAVAGAASLGSFAYAIVMLF